VFALLLFHSSGNVFLGLCVILFVHYPFIWLSDTTREISYFPVNDRLPERTRSKFPRRHFCVSHIAPVSLLNALPHGNGSQGMLEERGTSGLLAVGFRPRSGLIMSISKKHCCLVMAALGWERVLVSLPWIPCTLNQRKGRGVQTTSVQRISPPSSCLVAAYPSITIFYFLDQQLLK
jgi:hypothetical protein